MRVLPGGVRRQISLAYLLARTTDTIADTELVDVASRLSALTALRRRILGRSAEPLPLAKLKENQGLPAERILLERSEESLKLLGELDERDRQLVRKVLDVIISGQELDLQRFGGASEKNIVALDSPADLDDYAYRVAGCVGEFWTEICAEHLWSESDADRAALLRDGIRFGKGLQLVNILRDIPKDLRQGRCYIPAQSLKSIGMSQNDLLLTENGVKFRQVYDPLLDLAQDHLTAGWRYVEALPKNQRRLRLGCAWPVLIGARTLQKLRAGNVLDASQRIKVSRPEVRAIIFRAICQQPISGAWGAQFRKELELLPLRVSSK